MNNGDIITPSQREIFYDSFEIDLETGCWLWKKAKHPFGYGVFRIGSLTDDTRKQVTAHRLSYELSNGPVPDGLLVCHHCDVPECINPDHLYAGTYKDNMRDAEERDRCHRVKHPFGERHPTAKLTDEQIAEIRASTDKNIELARRYGVTKEYMWRIRNYRVRT